MNEVWDWNCAVFSYCLHLHWTNTRKFPGCETGPACLQTLELILNYYHPGQTRDLIMRNIPGLLLRYSAARKPNCIYNLSLLLKGLKGRGLQGTCPCSSEGWNFGFCDFEDKEFQIPSHYCPTEILGIVTAIVLLVQVRYEARRGTTMGGGMFRCWHHSCRGHCAV